MSRRIGLILEGLRAVHEEAEKWYEVTVKNNAESEYSSFRKGEKLYVKKSGDGVYFFDGVRRSMYFGTVEKDFAKANFEYTGKVLSGEDAKKMTDLLYYNQSL